MKIKQKISSKILLLTIAGIIIGTNITFGTLLLLNSSQNHNNQVAITTQSKQKLKPQPATPDPPEPPPPPPEPPSPPATTIPPSSTRIAYLTFDDGPSPYTLDLLQVLKDNAATATFFVTGKRDEIYQSIINGGHAIGLHSNTHNYATIYTSETAFFDDLAVISRRVEAQVGYAPKITRFPGGSSNTVSRRYNAGIMTRLSSLVHEHGYRYYDWNCATGDGGGSITVQAEINSIASCGNSILYILAHDTIPQTLQAMRTIIPALKDRGYTFLPITPETPEYHHRINN